MRRTCRMSFRQCSSCSDLIDELQQLLGKQITSLDIAKCIDKETFLDFEDGGKERFRLKILRSIYGVYQ